MRVEQGWEWRWNPTLKANQASWWLKVDDGQPRTVCGAQGTVARLQVRACCTLPHRHDPPHYDMVFDCHFP